MPPSMDPTRDDPPLRASRAAFMARIFGAADRAAPPTRPTVVAATKWDAVKSSQRFRHLRAFAAVFEDSERPLLPVSSETGENLPTLGRLLKDRLIGRTREGAAPAAPQGPSQKES